MNWTNLIFACKFFLLSSLCRPDPSDIHYDVGACSFSFLPLHFCIPIQCDTFIFINQRTPALLIHLINLHTFTVFALTLYLYFNAQMCPKIITALPTLRHSFNTITTYLPSHSHKLPIRLEHRCWVES